MLEGVNTRLLSAEELTVYRSFDRIDSLPMSEQFRATPKTGAIGVIGLVIAGAMLIPPFIAMTSGGTFSLRSHPTESFLLFAGLAILMVGLPAFFVFGLRESKAYLEKRRSDYLESINYAGRLRRDQRPVPRKARPRPGGSSNTSGTRVTAS